MKKNYTRLALIYGPATIATVGLVGYFTAGDTWLAAFLGFAAGVLTALLETATAYSIMKDGTLRR